MHRRVRAKAEAGEPLTVAGDGSQSRRFVYVEDLAEGVVAALRPEAANRIYNLAGDEEVTILQIAEAVRDQVADTGIVHTPARTGDFGGKEVSSGRAAEELGWTRAHPFAEGFRRYLDWRRARPEPAAGPDPHRRHRRGPRPAGARARRDLACRAARASRSRSSTACGPWAGCSPRWSATAPGSSFNWLPWLFELQYFLLAARSRRRAGWRSDFGCLLGARRLLRDDPSSTTPT